MGELIYKKGNILDCDETILCHQCNCVSSKAEGLAKQIFEKWPVSNVYKENRSDRAGTVSFTNVGYYNSISEILICNPSNTTIIAHLFGQIYPGRPNWGIDSKEKRLEYFRKCLRGIIDFHFYDYSGSGIESGQININNTYAFPYKIGCGLARGSWDHYLKQIEKFAKIINTRVAIYKL